MAFDTKKWLVDELGFSDAEATELAPKFTEDRAKKLEGGFLRQADYSKRMNEFQNEVKKTQKDLADANERLNNEMAAWAEMTSAEKAKATQQRVDLEKAQQDVLRLTQKITTVAEQAGIDPKTLLEGTTVTPPKTEDTKPPVDLSGYAKAGDVGAVANMALRLPAQLAKIAREHQALTGKVLDEDVIIDEIQRRANTRGNTKSLDPKAVWEELNDVPALRETVAKKQYDEAIAAAEARGREAALTESSIPGQPPAGKHSPVFSANRGAESKFQRPQPGTRLQGAIAALRTGKYKDGKSA